MGPIMGPVSIVPHVSRSYDDHPALGHRPVFDRNLYHVAPGMDRNQVERQMFTDRKRNLDIVFDEIGHNSCQSDIPFVLRMVPHMSPSDRRISTLSGS